MKATSTLSFLFSIFFVVSIIVAVPVKDPNDDAETIAVPPGHQSRPENDANPETHHPSDPDYGDFDGVIISDVNPGFFSYSPVIPYSWNLDFFSRFQDMLKQIRDQAWAYTPSLSSVPGFGIDLENLPEEGKNSTSKVEIIDGHRVITNDTIITHKTDFGDAIVSIRVVDIEPLDHNDTETINPLSVEQHHTENHNHSPEEHSVNDNEIMRDYDHKSDKQVLLSGKH